MQSTEILLNETDGVATITLNNPDNMNSLTFRLVSELQQAINELKADLDVKVLVLTGTGRAFCAGGDLKAMRQGLSAAVAQRYMESVNEIIFSLINLDRPVICAVNGFAIGAGWNLALTADVLLAVNSAKFSQGFVNMGLIPDAGGTYLLPRLVGIFKAKQLIFSGETIDALEAERLGLVSEVLPAEQLMEKVAELAGKLAHGPSKALGLAKVLLNRSLDEPLKTVLEAEAFAQALSMQTTDHREGLSAFFEKRQPKFAGK